MPLATLHPSSAAAPAPATPTAVEAREKALERDAAVAVDASDRAVCPLLAVDTEAADSCATLAASQTATGGGPLPGSSAAATKDERDDEMAASLADNAVASCSGAVRPIVAYDLVDNILRCKIT